MYTNELFLLLSVFPISLSLIIFALFLDEIQFENSLLNKKADNMITPDTKNELESNADKTHEDKRKLISLHDYVWDVQAFFSYSP